MKKEADVEDEVGKLFLFLLDMQYDENDGSFCFASASSSYVDMLGKRANGENELPRGFCVLCSFSAFLLLVVFENLFRVFWFLFILLLQIPLFDMYPYSLFFLFLIVLF